jgi:hypothetical protein
MMMDTVRKKTTVSTRPILTRATSMKISSVISVTKTEMGMMSWTFSAASHVSGAVMGCVMMVGRALSLMHVSLEVTAQTVGVVQLTTV